MRLLLDENFPADFAQHLGDGVFTVHGLGWAGVKNGDLLRRAHSVCDAFITLDRNLQFQQNIRPLPFGVVVVQSVSNRLIDLIPLATKIIEAANRVKPGQIEIAGSQ